MLPGHSANLLQDLIPVFCQIYGIQAPVMGVCPPLNEAPFLKIVEDCHQAAGVNLKLSRELLLAHPSLDPEKPQDPRIRRREFENPQSFSKLRRGMRSKLGKQERRLFLSHLIAIHLLLRNYCIIYSFII
jgi:hypothetical protein